MRKLYIYIGVILLLIAVCFVFFMVQPMMFPLNSLSVGNPHLKEADRDKPPDTIAPINEPEGTEEREEPEDTEEKEEPEDTEETEEPVDTEEKEEPEDMEETEESEKTEEPIPYNCPEKLTEARAQSPDVYAWINIPGTNVDYPVVQSPTNDAYYLRRDIYGNYLISGSIMSEHTYNGTDFEDPVTIIYGHCMKSGAMFGNLQTYYSSENGLEDYSQIEIYLPDRKLEYEVFAAVPYDMRHILYNYDFTNPRIFSSFFKSIVSIRSFNANINAEEKPKYDDKVLILSTCLKGDSTQRYLVMAKLK